MNEREIQAEMEQVISGINEDTKDECSGLPVKMTARLLLRYADEIGSVLKEYKPGTYD